MRARSWLFVPGDAEAKLEKAPGLGADVLIVDLEDAVAPGNKEAGRAIAAAWLERHRTQVVSAPQQRWARINALDTPWWRDDLAAVMAGAPSGIMVPKVERPEQLQTVAAELYENEQRHGVPVNTTRLLPLVSETPRAALTIPAYADVRIPRLAGLTWGAEDLSAAIGATRKRDSAGWADTFRLVRSQTLLAAHCAGVMAIDTLHADFRDIDGLKAIAAASFADGFAGMLAIHPAQVPIINDAFSPSAEALDHARRVVAAFEDYPGIGALQLDGRMLDRPHLDAARRLLDSAD